MADLKPEELKAKWKQISVDFTELNKYATDFERAGNPEYAAVYAAEAKKLLPELTKLYEAMQAAAAKAPQDNPDDGMGASAKDGVEGTSVSKPGGRKSRKGKGRKSRKAKKGTRRH